MSKAFVLLAAAAILAGSAFAAPACPPVGNAVCAESGRGVAIASTEGEAAGLLAALDAAAGAFTRHFGAAAPLAFIVEGAARASALKKEVGSPPGVVFLPWIGAAEKRDAIRSALREQILAAQPGLDEPTTEALISGAANEAFAQLALDPLQEQGAVAHELCHLFLIESFRLRGGETAAGASHYGGAAPDWLDETAAVLCENEALKAGRYDALARVRDGEKGAGFWPLRTFLSMPHPLSELTKKMAAEASDDGVAVKVFVDEGVETLADGAEGIESVFFYVEARLFADFLMERSGDSGIFGSVARDIAKGRSFDKWLAKNARRRGLPRTMAALERAWDEWLAQRLSSFGS